MERIRELSTRALFDALKVVDAPSSRTQARLGRAVARLGRSRWRIRSLAPDTLTSRRAR